MDGFKARLAAVSKMGERQSDWSFRLMALSFKLRDMRKPRAVFLNEAGVTPGLTVLDYGCGAGSYVAPAARMVGPKGHVFALDVNPTALRMVRERIEKARLTNVTTILSDCATGLSDDSVDVVLLYDIYHHLAEPTRLLAELRRVLKQGGILSSHDHHLKGDVLQEAIESSGLFRLTRKGTLTYSFSPPVHD